MKITLVAGITADGFIARHETHAADWTSKEDKRHFSEVTKRIGAMIMGSTTYDTIGRPLPGRRMFVMTNRPDDYRIQGLEPLTGEAAEICAKLEKTGVKELAVIGGGKVYGQFMAAGLVDELILTVEPHVFGTGITLFAQALDQKLRLISLERLGENSAVLHYKVER